MSRVNSIPLAELPDDLATKIDREGAKQVNLYRCLAHSPDLLRAWIDFAWALRGHSATSRQLRELIILRTAMIHQSPYEWHQHRRMAAQAGVSDYEVAELEMWRTSRAFSPETRRRWRSPTHSSMATCPTRSTRSSPPTSTSRSGSS